MAPGGCDAVLYEDAAGAGKDAPARDGGPGVSWARASGMGDSNTAGGAGGMDVATESYPAQLSVLLGGEDWDVRNFGKGGRTVVDTQGRA